MAAWSGLASLGSQRAAPGLPALQPVDHRPGNLGQAFAWLLSALPYGEQQKATLVLQDFDRIAASNDSTSPLSFRKDIGRRKGRVISDWLEERGFQTIVEERRFGDWIRRSPEEPRVALCGVDNTIARTALEEAGFDLVVEAGLGAGPEAFRSLAMHTFPATRTAKEIWSRQISDRAVSPESMPAYQQLKKAGMDFVALRSSRREPSGCHSSA